ncbi:Hypothetical predicted protein [Lecanosticta acicola]|uniref:Uncharacterized protein n=1 Tax=Lecanosticta acicola TaxID=111012 RepID=A0AAI8W1Z6_9PEZI|nr:Hypothetical predicted protein [Lecanosticta acicola]
MADKTWEQKMKEIEEGKSAAEVHHDPNPTLKFSLFGDENEDPGPPGKRKKARRNDPDATAKNRIRYGKNGKGWSIDETLELLKLYRANDEDTHDEIARQHSIAFHGHEKMRTKQSCRFELNKYAKKADSSKLDAEIKKLEQRKLDEEKSGGDTNSCAVEDWKNALLTRNKISAYYLCNITALRYLAFNHTVSRRF